MLKSVLFLSLLVLVNCNDIVGGYFNLPKDIEIQTVDVRIVPVCDGEEISEPLTTMVFLKGFCKFFDLKSTVFMLIFSVFP